jgi:L-ectoine synthase
MKVNTINDVKGTDRDVLFTGGNSQRVVLEKDGLGFAVMKTNIKKGGPYHWHYPNHLEACYCISGKGILKSLEDGSVFEINVDSCYILDKHDDHTFEALTDVVLISVFNPPLKGDETHDENGKYKL